jgi:hypothetical protein
VTCAREGASSVTGSGPAGSLDTSHVYVSALTGFCPDELEMIVTSDDPLAWPYLGDSGVIFAQITPGYLDGTAEWSGTFAAMISLPDGGAAASGTLQVDRSTPAFVRPNQLRATVRFDDGAWRFTATIEAPYCSATVCI